MRSDDKLTHGRDGRSQTHNPLISLPPHVTIKPRFKKYSPHFEHRFETFGNARVLGTGVLWREPARVALARPVRRRRAEWSARGRPVRGARAAPPQPRLPAWKFDFSDVSSAPCFATIEPHRTARHRNAQHSILHMSICSNIFKWLMPPSPNADGRNVRRGRSTHISICSRKRRLSDLDIFRTRLLAFGGGTRLNKGINVRILRGFP